MKNLLLLGVMLFMISCSSDEANTLNTPVTTVPEWLEGQYVPEDVDTDASYITQDEMHLNLSFLSPGPVYFFYMNDVESELVDGNYVVHYYDGVDITFHKLTDTRITITVDDNGEEQEYGTFLKIN